MLIKELSLRDHIPQSTISAGNRSSSWEPGYLEKYGLINISRDGTIGSLVQVGDLKIVLPQKPRGKKDILFHERSRSDQFWRRSDLPLRKNTKMSRRDFENKYSSMIDVEWDRREKGCWFYRNGSPTYITGGHYFYLQHFRIDVGAPKYREASRAWYYFWEACVVDKRCMGMIFCKSRRVGFSYMAASEILNRGTRTASALFGVISKTNKDGASLFTKKLVPAWKSLWEPFKPEFEPSNHKQNIVLTEDLRRRKKDDDYEAVDLETVIDYRATTLDSYDSEKLTVQLGDEVGKFPKECPIQDYWGKVSSTFTAGRNIKGKALWGSTVNASNRGGSGYKTLWNDSDYNERFGKQDRTSTGMYRFFISAYDNYEGCFDRYGNCIREDPKDPIIGEDGEMITEGSISSIQTRIASKSTPELRLNERREYPSCVEDAFLEPVGQNVLDVARINEQIEYNERMGIYPVRYTLKWKDGIRDSEVVAVPSPESGNFYMSWLMPVDLRNKFKTPGGSFEPMNYKMGAGGCDSFDHNQTVDNRFSDGAFHFKTRSSIANPLLPHNSFFIEYVHRPAVANIFYEDLLMACAYTGMPVLIEDAKPGIINYFESRGYSRFLLPRPIHLIPQNQRSNAALIMKPGIPSTKDIVIEHGNELSDYIMDNVGVTSRDPAGDAEAWGSFPFDRTMKDWLGFDINDRKKSDATVSSGLAILATRASYHHLAAKSPSNYVRIGLTKKTVTYNT